MTMKTNISFVSSSTALGFVASPTPGSVSSFSLGSIASSSSASINDSTFGYIIISAPNANAGRVAFVVIDSKTTFFYGK